MPAFALNEGALDNTTDAVIALDEVFRVTAWNRAAERVYGIPASTALGQPFAELISCRRDARDGALGRATPLDAFGLADGAATHCVGGRDIPVLVSLIPLDDASGHRYLAIIHNDPAYAQMAVSFEQRLNADRLLSDLSARFSELPEDQIDGEIELWLRRLTELLGAGRGTFAELTTSGFVVTHTYAGPGVEPFPKGPANKALPWLTEQYAARRTVVLPDDLPDHAIAEQRHVAESGIRAGIGIPISVGDPVVCVLGFASFSGPRAWPAEVIARLQLAGSAFANAIARRRAKQRLDQQHQQLAHVGRVAATGELAAVIAHELDQPITAIVSNAEAVRYLLHKGELDLAEADDALKDVIDSAMRVSEIVERERQLLRKSPQRFEPVDLNEVVREIELFIRADARQGRTRVTLELQPGLPAIAGDRVQLQQVVLNLAHNGLQAMRDLPPETRELTIRTAAATREVLLSVRDSGPPVEDGVVERMFEPFFTTKANGLGMGLSISKSILDAHRGRIRASRNRGTGGLTVHVDIPRM